MAPNRTAAEKYITDVVKFLGGNTSIAIKVQELLDFEAKLEENLNDPDETPLRILTLDQLQQEVPQFNWSKHLNQMFAPHNIPGTEVIHVALPYLKKTMELVQNASKSVLANYLVWHVIKKEVAYSSFSHKAPNSTVNRSVEDDCVYETEEPFIDLMEAAYVTTYGKKITKIKNMVEQLTNEIRQAFKENVNSLTWLDTNTRRTINEKVDNIRNKIGFPDYLSSPGKVKQNFQKYNTLILKKDEYFKNKIALSKFDHQQMLMRFRQPVIVDRGWPVFAHEGKDGVEYLDDSNWIVQPLASLRPPFFYESEFLRAFNFGAIGASIGKAITMSVGHRGRQYDKNGLPLSTAGQGWSRKSLQEIDNRGSCFATQYSQYKLFGSWRVDGNLNYFQKTIDTVGFKAVNKLKSVYK
ncbi:endothelin-converting enzyme 2-like [Actinia tenebrosa]|uniref:Endothelin-converting enzyme 2-like n=1 Tax=Actinia tenebrosa TaxID=6105 RepID=A0A6P8HVP7_ACTTE|nr:endothelin-converting enzyme 2-like [Actinia tenebrosa]